MPSRKTRHRTLADLPIPVPPPTPPPNMACPQPSPDSGIDGRLALDGHFEPGQTKKVYGVALTLTNGAQFMFGPTAIWRWTRIAGMPMLIIREGGMMVFQAKAEAVVCVGGPGAIFRDAEWKPR